MCCLACFYFGGVFGFILVVVSSLLCSLLVFFLFLVQVLWFLSFFPLQRVSAGRATAGMTFIGDALKCFCLQNIQTQEAWQSTSVMLLPIFEKLPKNSDWNWPVVFILLSARDRFAGLEHFNILFHFLLANNRLLTDFMRKGGPESSQKASCVLWCCARYCLQHIQSFHPGDWFALSQRNIHCWFSWSQLEKRLLCWCNVK